MREKLVEIPIYDVNMIFLDVTDIDKLHEYFNKLDLNIKPTYPTLNHLKACTISHQFTKNGKNDWFCIYVLFNMNSEYSKVTVGTLAHEALHVVKEVWNFIQSNFEKDNQEPEAYLIAWVVNQMCDFLNINKEI